VRGAVARRDAEGLGLGLELGFVQVKEGLHVGLWYAENAEGVCGKSRPWAWAWRWGPDHAPPRTMGKGTGKDPALHRGVHEWQAHTYRS